MTPPPPRSTLFPYTTLFRSALVGRAAHEPQRLTHTVVAKDVQEWRLPQVDGQCLLESSIKHRVAGGVKKVDRKSTRLNSSHGYSSYAVFCLKKKKEYAKPSA